MARDVDETGDARLLQRQASAIGEPVSSESPISSDSLDSEPRGPGASHAEQARANLARRRLTWLVVGGILLLVATVGLAGAKSYRDLAAAKQRASELETQIRETEIRVKELDRRIDMLLDDPELLEHLARENLGLVAPDEVVVMLPEERLE